MIIFLLQVMFICQAESPCILTSNVSNNISIKLKASNADVCVDIQNN